MVFEPIETEYHSNHRQDFLNQNYTFSTITYFMQVHLYFLTYRKYFLASNESSKSSSMVSTICGLRESNRLFRSSSVNELKSNGNYKIKRIKCYNAYALILSNKMIIIHDSSRRFLVFFIQNGLTIINLRCILHT